MKLAAEYDPDKVASILNLEKFPLDEALVICKQYNNLAGIAFIQFRNGVYDGVFETYLEVLLIDYDR